MSHERRPSDTVPIDRRQLLEMLVAEGRAVICPCCAGDGAVSPKLAARVRPALPAVPSERPTLPELPESEDT